MKSNSMKLTWLPKVSNLKGHKEMWVSKSTTRALCFFESQLQKRKMVYIDNRAQVMTGNISYFAYLSRVDGGNVTHCDNGKGKIIGDSSIDNFSRHIGNGLYVEGLNIIF